MTGSRPLPGDVTSDDLDQPFWDGCRNHQFLIHRCTACGRVYWPASCCVVDGSAHMEWVPASGSGQVHTFTIVHHVYNKTFLDIPYNVAVVKLSEGPLFHSAIVDSDEIRIGTEVEVVFQEFAAHFTLPFFRPKATQK